MILSSTTNLSYCAKALTFPSNNKTPVSHSEILYSVYLLGESEHKKQASTSQYLAILQTRHSFE